MLDKRLPDSYIVQEGTMLGYIMSSPMYVDSADDSNVYLGYCKINANLDKDSTLLICKIKIEGDLITKVWAYGSWADKEVLQYK